MQTENRLFDDIARVASGAFNTLGGLREEIEMRVRERVERLASEMELVSREELEAVEGMARKARSEQEAMAERLAVLEQELATLRAQSGGGAQSVEGADTEASTAREDREPTAQSSGLASATGNGGEGTTGEESQPAEASEPR